MDKDSNQNHFNITDISDANFQFTECHFISKYFQLSVIMT